MRKWQLQIRGNMEMKKEKNNTSGERKKKLLKNKLHSRNLIKMINTCSVVVRHSEAFLKWTREELQEMD